jgi:N6-adenosine-specific RNA methylase IME4
MKTIESENFDICAANIEVHRFVWAVISLREWTSPIMLSCAVCLMSAMEKIEIQMGLISLSDENKMACLKMTAEILEIRKNCLKKWKNLIA